MNSVDIFNQFNGTEPIFGMAMEAGVLKSTPELAVLNAITVPQTSFQTLAAENVSGARFRNVDEYIAPSTVTFAKRTVQTKYLDAHWSMDIAAGTNAIERKDTDHYVLLFCTENIAVGAELTDGTNSYVIMSVQETTFDGYKYLTKYERGN